ncbi:unnamed protein product [Mytilus coruscus]|uniref:Uncharacterized protein n=1 Tax=Mytilus coruscus TaxID=42192 RepID=A0A6J8BKI3_MYTCO|nr:unnamed protein product [Mytilus coruscus]
MDASTVMNEISKVLQSNEELPVDDSFSVTVGRIDIPSGGGRVYITNLKGVENSLKRKRSIISRPSEMMCMPIANTVCFLKTCRTVSSSEWHTLTSDDTGCMPDKVLKHRTRTAPQCFYKHVIDKGRKECFYFAKRLCEIADVSTEKQCSINDIERFEKVVDLLILVISSKLGNKFIRIGENETGRKKAFLYLIDDNECGHFAAIVRNSLSCRACNRTCRSIACFQRHIEEKTTKKGLSYTECGKIYECKTCKKVLVREERPPELHQCGEWKCVCCRDYQPEAHLCYQRAINTERTDKQMIFFDCETTQDTLLQCENVNLQSSSRCQNCKDKEESCNQCTLCQNCGKSWCGSKEHKVNFICMVFASRCVIKRTRKNLKMNHVPIHVVSGKEYFVVNTPLMHSVEEFSRSSIQTDSSCLTMDLATIIIFLLTG